MSLIPRRKKVITIRPQQQSKQQHEELINYGTQSLIEPSQSSALEPSYYQYQHSNSPIEEDLDDDSLNDEDTVFEPKAKELSLVSLAKSSNVSFQMPPPPTRKKKENKTVDVVQSKSKSTSKSTLKSSTSKSSTSKSSTSKSPITMISFKIPPPPTRTKNTNTRPQRLRRKSTKFEENQAQATNDRELQAALQQSLRESQMQVR